MYVGSNLRLDEDQADLIAPLQLCLCKWELLSLKVALQDSFWVLLHTAQLFFLSINASVCSALLEPLSYFLDL